MHILLNFIYLFIYGMDITIHFFMLLQVCIIGLWFARHKLINNFFTNLK
jgi:hypothetical protein